MKCTIEVLYDNGVKEEYGPFTEITQEAIKGLEELVEVAFADDKPGHLTLPDKSILNLGKMSRVTIKEGE
ncbi:hypothetical protein MKZ02_20080 [Pseudobacillus sp. FSL P4-0506]|uniref:hypothetical protein n=1 Tax=Pseudobacillus sp. FSL P4-0506 TaxID=2921576 RepID=UPI0030F4EB68